MQRGDEEVKNDSISKAMPEGLKVWLIASLVLLVGSLMMFAGDVAAGFAYFTAKTPPPWVPALGLAAVIGIVLGIAGLVVVFFLTTLKSRREKPEAVAEDANSAE
jgi:H+/Cl- antiporter ClcA